MPGVGNSKQEASVGGAVAAAHYIRSVAPCYDIPVVLHTVRRGSLHVSADVLSETGPLCEKAFAMARRHGKVPQYANFDGFLAENS